MYLLVFLRPVGQHDSLDLHVTIQQSLQCRHVAFDHVLHLQKAQTMTATNYEPLGRLQI